MDLDFPEIADDKVQTFLTTKLEAIRLQNEALESTLNEHQQALNDIIPKCQEDLRIENVWKRIFSRNYVIGFEILSPKPFENIEIVLMSDLEESLDYKVQTFTLVDHQQCTCAQNCQYIICDLLKKAECFDDKAYVVISFNSPYFFHKLEYQISGYVICTLEGEEINVPIPKIQLLSKDSMFRTNWLIEKHALQNLFTAVGYCNVIDLVVCLPEEWTTPVVNTFEIHCSLSYIPLKNKAYFVANKMSEVFDNTIVIVHPHELNEDIFIKVYTSSDEQLFALIHHLLSCIPDTIIVPTMFYQSMLLSRKQSSKNILEDFKKAMRGDLEHSYNYAKMACWKMQLEDKSLKFKQQRKTLSEQEGTTDFCYLQAMKM